MKQYEVCIYMKRYSKRKCKIKRTPQVEQFNDYQKAYHFFHREIKKLKAKDFYDMPKPDRKAYLKKNEDSEYAIMISRQGCKFNETFAVRLSEKFYNLYRQTPII